MIDVPPCRKLSEVSKGGSWVCGVQWLCLSLLLWATAFLPIHAQATGRPGDRPLVVASASIFADMAEVIAGPELEVRSIVPVGGDPHTFEPTPEAAELVANADLILVNGLTFEGWILELIATSGSKAPVVVITEGIAPLGSLSYANSADPHAWMSALNGQVYARNVYQALSEHYTAFADQFAFNFGIYLKQLQDLDRWIRDTIAVIPVQHRVLVTSHDAFQYYGREYGLRLEAILGTSTDADAQMADVARVVNLVKNNGLPALFVESTVNPRLIRQIAEDTGARIGGSLFSDSLGEKGGPGDTYLKMLRHNTRTIVGGLASTIQAENRELAESGGGSIPALVLVLLLIFAAGTFVMLRYGQQG